MTTHTLSLTAQLLDILTAQYGASADTTADTEFENLDFDSLVLVEFAVVLTKRYGVEITDDELHAAGTVRRTAELLASKGIAD